MHAVVVAYMCLARNSIDVLPAPASLDSNRLVQVRLACLQSAAFSPGKLS